MSAPVWTSSPTDELTFEEYSRRYNFHNTAARSPFFTSLLVQELERRERPRRVLDIGCGRGMARNVTWTRVIREHTDDFWGIEPDTDVTPEEGLFDRFQHALMEDAELPEDTFDLAYSYMVMEHVADPPAFLRAVHRVLRPGGRYYFITPNGRHYFALITRSLKAMRLDELVLRMIHGKGVDEYHYPVQYRCNTPRDIGRHAVAVGFATPEYVLVEERGPEGYLRGPLRPFLHLMDFKRRTIRNPNCLLNVVARLTKPSNPEGRMT